MIRQIRKSMFETNSSSCHTFTISADDFLDQKQSSLRFNLGEYGWDQCYLTTPEEKAAYLYTAIMCFGNNVVELICNIQNVLNKNKIKYTFENPFKQECNDSYYIDHQSEDEAKDLIEKCKDESELMKFLFSSDSKVKIDNDNH